MQPMLAGGSYTTAWKYCHDHNKKYLIISVGYSLETEDSFREAEDHICKIVGTGLENSKMRHSLWWQECYNKSFLTIPDKAIEKFYWIQMYKIASASRPDGPVIDTCGPWLKNDTGWPAVWWNLNVQLTYWICYTSNHLDLAESLINNLDRHYDALRDNTPLEYRADSLFLGNPTNQDFRCARFYTNVRNVGTGEMETSMELNCLPWICHNYWLYYRCKMDDKLLRERLFPLMRGILFCGNGYGSFAGKGFAGEKRSPTTVGQLLDQPGKRTGDRFRKNIKITKCRRFCYRKMQGVII